MDLKALNIHKNKIAQFNNKNIYTIEDLVNFFPKKYYDFRKVKDIKDLVNGDICSIIGKIEEITEGSNYIRAKIRDRNNWFMYIFWFNVKYIKKLLKKNIEYVFCGKIQVDATYKTKTMVNPIRFGTNKEELLSIYPVYPKIQGISDDYLKKSINTGLALIDKKDYLEPYLIKKFNLIPKFEALKNIHQPKDEKSYRSAKKRLIFDDLFLFNMQLIERQELNIKTSPFIMKKSEKVREFLEKLPFELTGGQKNVLRNIFIKMKKGERVNALVQGDVGSGKTMVAIISMIYAYENGYQSVLMCPTLVLAKQHYDEILKRTKGLGCKVAFLSSETKAKEKKEILNQLKNGEIDILVGTHSVISEEVKFKNLALIVVDEEHRFGVIQRNVLKEKAKEGVHNITMSATPIPRTLALALYGNSIDVLTIDTMPNGRKPVITKQMQDKEIAFDFMYSQIKEGRQCYVVCPLIEDSDAEVLEEVVSVETLYEELLCYFKKYPDVKISMISGKMKQKDIVDEIEKFAKNETQILVSTTIIEVGVNVPNATVMVISNAERFGLAQLHQLRGRVGRGEHQSYCILLSKHKNPKLDIMCRTTNGFVIAEEDLKLRGAGDFIGTKQTGYNKYVLLMLAYPKFNQMIKEEVLNIYKNKNRLDMYKFLNNIEL